jgi:hypothetical protein
MFNSKPIFRFGILAAAFFALGGFHSVNADYSSITVTNNINSNTISTNGQATVSNNEYNYSTHISATANGQTKTFDSSGSTTTSGTVTNIISVKANANSNNSGTPPDIKVDVKTYEGKNETTSSHKTLLKANSANIQQKFITASQYSSSTKTNLPSVKSWCQINILPGLKQGSVWNFLNINFCPLPNFAGRVFGIFWRK